MMPDLFAGDPAPNSNLSAADLADQSSSAAGAAPSSSSLLDVFKVKALETAKSFLIDMWLARHTEEKVMPILEKVLEGAKDEFADAVSHGGGVYAVGYCFGARYVLLLAAERPAKRQEQRRGDDEEANKPATVPPQIKAGALAHATLVSKQDFVGLKAPLSVVCVEDDPVFPDEVRIAGEKYMTENGVEHEVQVYPGMPHGECNLDNYPPRPHHLPPRDQRVLIECGGRNRANRRILQVSRSWGIMTTQTSKWRKQLHLIRC